MKEPRHTWIKEKWQVTQQSLEDRIQLMVGLLWEDTTQTTNGFYSSVLLDELIIFNNYCHTAKELDLLLKHWRVSFIEIILEEMYKWPGSWLLR